MSLLTANETRWQEEARFFDGLAERAPDERLRTDPASLERYARPRLRRRFNKELRFRLLGDLRGKRILDVGCGEGQNVALFAHMGARVTGLDVSPGAISVARRRMECNGLSERVRLVCAPLETADLPEGSFDVVWGDGILHHVLPELELCLRRAVHWCRPGGTILFSEPLNLSPALRRLRQLIPVVTEATPGERPLVRAELDLLKSYVPDLEVTHFNLLGRLDPFILTDFNYERSSWARRAVVNVLDAFDAAVLSLPLVCNLGGAGVLYGHRQVVGRA